MNTPSRQTSPVAPFDAVRAFTDISAQWDGDILTQLMEYLAIPAKSPAFDPDWVAHGHLETVLRNAARWIEAQKIAGLKVEIVRLEGRTPLLFFEVAAHGTALRETVLMYGHMDKQPEFSGWRSDLGPWTPKYEDGRLYGRGSADDGYAVYAGIAALRAIQAQDVAHPRIIGLIETCEESGSPDLLSYVNALRARLGEVGLVICLDSGAGDYDRLWLTPSLRGLASGTLKVQVLTEGVHSGDASGLVPSSFRIMRQLLDRLEDSQTGRLLPASLHCAIPAERLEQARATAAILGDTLYRPFPWAPSAGAGGADDGAHVQPATTDPLQALLARTWHPTLSVISAEGFAPPRDAGNVLRPFTALKLSLRLPPRVDAARAVRDVKALLEARPPYRAQVSFVGGGSANGWDAPPMPAWFTHALDAASSAHFGAPCGFIGQGGTIPLMNMLSASFPKAQMMVCGVLGPNSNAHGPNEFLHVPYVKKLTAAVAGVIAAWPLAQAEP
ncbi:MAG: M20/M25/M40 family metallo-hydrolase [Burkholderiaceae bacterium]|jgi:acetylornithine deacetylase/succinyl-diaminopimelate desuccinylase-like protein|nr:M20/M25/M40 family metallo-hydrolase [Burkholderiaceae bacterium]